MTELGSWNDTATRKAIVAFVKRVTTEGGPDYVPPADRVAVFDNDGTLWCEKPMPIELGFILARLAGMAGGNSNGAIPMLRYTGGNSRPALRLLVLHDDENREFAYTAGAEAALERARADHWTLVSCKGDWSAVFADAA